MTRMQSISPGPHAFPKLERLLPETVAWDYSQPPQVAAFSPAFLDEIGSKRLLLQQEIPLQGIALDNDQFPCLRAEAEGLKARYLDSGSGFVILRGLAEVLETAIERENVFWRLCLELGDPFVQKSGSIRFGRVENLGAAGHERPRYHETGAGGSIHTDSPIMPKVADFVGLICVRTALAGGQSKFVSVAKVHNILLQHAGDLLDVLYEPFYFDRRLKPEDVGPVNPATLFEPIFSYDPALGDQGLRLRWQPEYVWQAPQLPGVPPLTDRQQLALHMLEGLLEDRAGDLTVTADMEAGDIQFLNNHLVAHGRSAFEDHGRADDPAVIDPDRRRLMRRVWMHRHNGVRDSESRLETAW